MTPEQQLQLRRRVAQYYLSPDRDTSSGGKPTLRYLICSTPRSGSTLLGDYLARTGLAGSPLEYLNDVYIATYRESVGLRATTFRHYIDDLERRRSSSNHVFGMKAHFAQMIEAFKKVDIQVMNSFLEMFDRFIIIERRDKIAQAVSWFRALKTGIWSSKHAELSEVKEVLPDFDPVAITKSLSGLITGENNWKKTLAERGKTWHTVYYEDLARSPGTVLEEVFRALSITERPAVWPEPSLSQQGSEFNRVCQARYLAFLTGTGETA